jgi:FkbM family methyltransferase
MYYGQNREDETINNLIVSKYGENFTGSILDLGANDGVTLSNSRFFVERGWKAVLVEAGSKPFSKLMLNATNGELCINCAIGRENGHLTFYESNNLLNTNDVGLVSSLVSDETVRWREAGIGFTEYKVDCYTWDSFLDKFHLKHRNFDIISIDIEGMDYDVLVQMNLEHLGCKVLCIEFNGKEIQKYIDYAVKYNMSLIHQNPENLIFIKN